MKLYRLITNGRFKIRDKRSSISTYANISSIHFLNNMANIYFKNYEDAKTAKELIITEIKNYAPIKIPGFETENKQGIKFLKENEILIISTQFEIERGEK